MNHARNVGTEVRDSTVSEVCLVRGGAAQGSRRASDDVVERRTPPSSEDRTWSMLQGSRVPSSASIIMSATSACLRSKLDSLLAWSFLSDERPARREVPAVFDGGTRHEEGE
jgi:hypothetical protein